jgi:hypothetical protein
MHSSKCIPQARGRGYVCLHTLTCAGNLGARLALARHRALASPERAACHEAVARSLGVASSRHGGKHLWERKTTSRHPTRHHHCLRPLDILGFRSFLLHPSTQGQSLNAENLVAYYVLIHLEINFFGSVCTLKVIMKSPLTFRLPREP